jgi:hypothetical protein
MRLVLGKIDRQPINVENAAAGMILSGLSEYFIHFIMALCRGAINKSDYLHFFTIKFIISTEPQFESVLTDRRDSTGLNDMKYNKQEK